jgi:hypothetical protein
MQISSACTPPVQPLCNEAEEHHPRFRDYCVYRAALTRQLVTAAPFARWLEDTEREENGFTKVFNVTVPGGRLSCGWHVNVFGPRHRLERTLGPFDTEQQANEADPGGQHG